MAALFNCIWDSKAILHPLSSIIAMWLPGIPTALKEKGVKLGKLPINVLCYSKGDSADLTFIWFYDFFSVCSQIALSLSELHIVNIV